MTLDMLPAAGERVGRFGHRPAELPPRRPWRPSAVRVAIGFAASAAFVTYTVIRGRALEREVGDKLHLGAAPLVGEWHARFGWGLLPAALALALVVWFGPWVADHVRLRALTPIAMLSGVVTTLALAAANGADELFAPVTDKSEYWASLAKWPPAGTFVDTFLQRINGYSVHTRGHPPGFPVTLLGGRSIGLDKPWFALSLSYIGVALTIGGVMWTVSVVADHDAAHRMAPWLVVAPYVVWMGTSADAWFAGLGALSVAALALAMDAERRGSRRAMVLFGAVGGLVFGWNIYNTYAAVLLGVLPLAFTLRMRTWRWIPAAVAGGLIPVLGYRAAGFWWFDGVRNTHDQYYYGTAQYRPYGYFLFGNLGALLIALGPAGVAGWALWKRRGPWVVPLAAFAALMITNLSGYTKAETERIWLMFMPWMLVGVAVTVHRTWPKRFGLATQGLAALALQVFLVSKW